jgi:hypothetical protein
MVMEKSSFVSMLFDAIVVLSVLVIVCLQMAGRGATAALLTVLVVVLIAALLAFLLV